MENRNFATFQHWKDWSRCFLLMMGKKSADHIAKFLDLYTGFLSVKEYISKSCCWFIKHWIVHDQNTFLICCHVMNHPDLWGRQVQVCFQSLESELNMVKQNSVIKRNMSGTKSLMTAGRLQLSPFLIQGWRPFCFPQPFTEAISRFWTALCLLFSSLVSFKGLKACFNLLSYF